MHCPKVCCLPTGEEACEVTEMFLNQMLGKEEESVHEIVDKAKYYISEHLTEGPYGVQYCCFTVYYP